MDQPNYNFAYQAGGIVQFVWKNAIGQQSTSSCNYDSSGNSSSSGKNNSFGNQQNKSNSEASNQQNTKGNNAQK